MANETTICVSGNIVSDPELRFTPNGAAVANLTIASTPRTFDKQANEWVDGETLFLRASVWREAAENVAGSLKKGMRVIVQGRLKSRSYETKEGEKRTSMELEIDEIGPSLRYATATVTRTQGHAGNSSSNFTPAPAQNGYAMRNGTPQGATQGNPAPQGNQPPQVDNWGSQQGGNYSWGNSEQAPF